MKFHEMVFTIQMDHAIIGGLLDSIARSNYKDARKKLAILHPLLVNHFLAEGFVLYPFMRKKMIKNDSFGQTRLFDGLDNPDVIALIKELEKHDSVSTEIISLISECMQAGENVFQEQFARMASRIRARIAFEETRLLSGVDTSKTKLLRKADFARLRIED
ncbi:MAG: hypothetical protein HQL87_07040 [Magnetococcales bacterium]|nr:hypothetical protein [Magnetococcales bacterium]